MRTPTPSSSGGLSSLVEALVGAGRGDGGPGAHPPRSSAPGLRETVGFGANPGGLRMFSHVPADLKVGSPLVVVLHGCGQGAESYDRGAGWSTLADRFGFAVLAPDQSRSNNLNGCFNWFKPSDTGRGRGEAASIREMIARCLQDTRGDPGRVFVTGLSAGGAMTSVMLAAYPEVFAGGAIIAGLPFGAAANVQQALASMRHAPARSPRAWGDLVRAASPHRGPWPRVSVWHGDSDTTVDPANAAAIVAQWADLHGVDPACARDDQVDGYPRRAWLGPDGTVALEAYSITGLAHGAPITAGSAAHQCGAAQAFVLEAGISSSYRIAEFWGLTGARHASAAGETQGADRERKPPASPPTRLSLDPKDVIAAALRAAGLSSRR